MATISKQKDLVVTLKKETILNIGILSKLQPMPSELSHQVFKENAFEKPTQTLFNHLSYYLVSMIDGNVCASLPWPLYDTKAERAYRNELSKFITDYSNKGLLCPVMSSYLVNPGCYKVTMLVFQMSQLSVQRLLTTKMKKDSQRKLCKDMAEKYKMKEKDEFLEEIENETDKKLRKFSNYMQKRKLLEKIAELFRKKIFEMETKLKSVNAQKYLDDLVDGFVKNHNLDDTTKAEIMKIKNVYVQAPFFDNWLLQLDRQLDEMESKWSEKVSPLLTLSKITQEKTETLISRCTGVAERNTYMIEYNHKTDFICTKDLQSQVNSQQKYILKNIVKNEILSFPNLIRGFLIAICFVLKNTDFGDEIYKFNEYLEGNRRSFSEILLQMNAVMERVMNAEAKLQPSPLLYHQSISVRDIPEIPPLPDLSDLLCTRQLQCQPLFDSFTPLSMSKHQFNLRKRTNFSFAKPQSKLLTTPFCHGPRDDFLKSLISCRVSSYDQPNLNVSQNFHNISVVSQNHRANETIAECSGFTKQQILRLFSTMKSSSSKKFRHKTEQPDINIKKRGLFNESTTSNDSNGLFRSYSSPNLYENREQRPLSRTGRRKLSIMQEDSPSHLEVSGIAALDKDSFSTPPPAKLISSKVGNTVSLPAITVTEYKFNEMLEHFEVDLNNLDETIKNKQEKTETPKNNAQIIKNTGSLEKIINRFKKVRASVLPDKTTDEFRFIAEEKENIHVDTANRVLLPDLLSPSCSVLSQKSDSEYLDKVCMDIDEKVRRKPRESLGTALGVDQTFLDQFDLID